MNYVEYNKNDIQKLEYEKTIVSDGVVAGACQIGKSEIQLINDSNEYSSFKDKWIQTPLGSMYIYDVTPVQEKINIKLSCYDIKYKMDIKYDKTKYENKFPMTIATWRNLMALDLGIIFNDNDDFPNADYILPIHPFIEDGVSYRNVFMLIAEAGCSAIDNDRYDNFYFRWFSSESHDIKDWHSLTTEKEYTAPINEVVLGRGNVESVVVYPNSAVSNPKEFRIDNNYILDPQDSNSTTDRRNEVIKPIYDRVNGFSNLIFSIETEDLEDCLNFNLGEKIKYFDIWDNELNPYSMTIKYFYVGGDFNDSDNYKVIISSSEMKETSTKFEYAANINDKISKVEMDVDKQNRIIASTVSTVSEQNDKISKVTQTVDEINSKISDIADITITGESEYGNVSLDNINQSEPIDIKIHPINEDISYLYPVDTESVRLIDGHHEQDSYSGKNLLNTPYNENNKLTKTSTKNDDFVITDYHATLEAGKTYTFFCETDGTFGDSSKEQECFLLLNKAYSSIYRMSSKDGYTFTPSVSGDYYLRYDVNVQGQTHYFWNFYIAEESEFSGYEPYVGGQSSPNPSYPQKVKTVPSIKNLFDKTDSILTNKYFDNNGNIITSLNANNYLQEAYISVNSNTDYVANAVGGKYLRLVEYDENKVFIKTNNSLTSNSISITTTSSTKYIRVSFTGEDTLNTFQLEEGPIAHDYVPYGNYVRVKITEKNLFDKDNASVLNAYFAGNLNVITAQNANRIIYNPCNPNTTYTLQQLKTNAFNIGYTNEIPTIGSTVYGMKDKSSAIEFEDKFYNTITTGNEAKYLVIRCWQTNDSMTLDELLNSIQIEEGDIATDYEPYQEKIYYLNLKDIELLDDEYLYTSNGKWYLHKEWGKVVLDGSENWDTITSRTAYRNRLQNITNILPNNSAPYIAPIYSNFYIKRSPNNTYNEIVGLSVNGKNIVIYDDVFNTQDVSLFKNWLSSHNLVVYYLLAEPTDIEVTNDDIEGLDQLDFMLSNGLYPSDDLYLKDRTLRFKNTKTDEIIDYELPLDLWVYDSNNYDEFLLSYDSQICQITKRVGIDKYGHKYLLDKAEIVNFDYPLIDLDDGDYEVSLLGYSTAYLFVRLMAQNIYTTQFATRVEVRSEINQSATEIKQEVSKSLNDVETEVSQIKQTSDNISITVAKKVGKDEVISSINQSAESVKIKAKNVDLNGFVTITDLQGDGTTEINGSNIKTGTMSADRVSGGTLKGITIEGNVINGGTINGSTINGVNIITNTDSFANGIVVQSNNAGTKLELKGATAVAINSSNESTIQMMYESGWIRCVNLIQTSLENQKKNFEKYINALDTIKEIDIYKFNYKNEKDIDKKHIGFVIGENYNYSSEITSLDEEGKEIGVDLYSMTSLCLQAIKEQQEIINKQQDVINKLEERIRTLEEN